MLLLAGSFDGLQVGVFIFVCFVLAGTIWLYRTSMDSIKKLQEEQRQQYSHLIETVDAEWNRPSWAQRFTQSFQYVWRKNAGQRLAPPAADASSALTPGDVTGVKQMLEQLQLLSHKQLLQLEQLQTSSNVESRSANDEARRRIEELELLVEQKEEAIRQLHAQQKITEKLSYKLERVQQDYFSLHERMKSLELQATQAPRLAMELEDSKAAYEQLYSDLSKKSAKVHQVVVENTQLHEQLADTEDKLQAANNQSQQLFKKVKFLEEMNGELQAVADTNKKLQVELRRIGELESMLNMIIEERNR